MSVHTVCDHGYADVDQACPTCWGDDVVETVAEFVTGWQRTSQVCAQLLIAKVDHACFMVVGSGPRVPVWEIVVNIADAKELRDSVRVICENPWADKHPALKTQLAGDECDGENCDDFEHQPGCSLYDEDEAIEADYQRAEDAIYAREARRIRDYDDGIIAADDH